jgi:Type-F conjugative transfer system protein (TrbI_Ftype)
VRNILATSDGFRRFAGLSPAGLLLAGALLAAVLWGAWATREILSLERREVVTVQLSRIMGAFIEAEARSGRPAEVTRARTLIYLKAVEAAVEALGQDGRTVLVAEAVVAGSVPDLTERVTADVARRLEATTAAEMGAAGHAPR